MQTSWQSISLRISYFELGVTCASQAQARVFIRQRAASSLLQKILLFDSSVSFWQFSWLSSLIHAYALSETLSAFKAQNKLRPVSCTIFCLTYFALALYFSSSYHLFTCLDVSSRNVRYFSSVQIHCHSKSDHRAAHCFINNARTICYDTYYLTALLWIKTFWFDSLALSVLLWVIYSFFLVQYILGWRNWVWKEFACVKY